MMSTVLVLDSAYQPHRKVSWERAVDLIFAGRAEVVRMYDDVLQRVSTKAATFSEQMRAWMAMCTERPNDDVVVLRMPAVIRLLRLVGRKRSVTFSRINVMTRDEFRCQFCHRRRPMRELNYDHVLPRARGGKTTWENIVIACYECNARKGNRTPEEAGMTLARKPVRPASLPVVAFHIDKGDRIHELWRDFVYWHVELET